MHGPPLDAPLLLPSPDEASESVLLVTGSLPTHAIATSAPATSDETTTDQGRIRANADAAFAEGVRIGKSNHNHIGQWTTAIVGQRD